MKISILVSFLSSSFSIMHNSKTIWCVQILLYIPSDCSPNADPFWFGSAWERWLVSYGLGTVSKDAARAPVTFLGLLLRIPGVARIVKPHPDYWTRVVYELRRGLRRTIVLFVHVELSTWSLIKIYMSNLRYARAGRAKNAKAGIDFKFEVRSFSPAVD